MSGQRDRFEEAICREEYAEAISIFHDYGDESYVRFLLDHMAIIRGTSPGVFVVNDIEPYLLKLEDVYSSSDPPTPIEGSVYFNLEAGCYLRFDGEGKWGEIYFDGLLTNCC